MMKFQGQKRTLQTVLNKILDEIITKYEDNPKKVTKTFIRGKLNLIMRDLSIATNAEIIQMFHSFWKDRRDKGMEKLYIDDICTDVLMEIVLDRKNSSVHFGEGLGFTDSKIFSCCFNEYFDKYSFIARPLRLRAKQVITSYKSENYSEANRYLVQLEQRVKILDSIMPNIVPEDTEKVGEILPKLHEWPKHAINMRQELRTKWRTAMKSNAVGTKRVAFAPETHSDYVPRSSSIIKKRKVASKTGSTRGDDGDKSDATPILTEATSSGADSDATPILDSSSTPVLGDQPSSGVDPEATPILDPSSTPLLGDQSSSGVDPEATPILGPNSTPTVGGATSTNMDPVAPSILGSTSAASNNEQDAIDDLLNSVFAPRSCSYQSRKPDVNPTVPTTKLLLDVVGDMNRGPAGTFVDYYFVARYLTLIVPKMWLQEVNGGKHNLEKTMGGDMSEDSTERIWNNGNFILKRLKSGGQPGRCTVLAKKRATGSWGWKPDESFNLRLGSTKNVDHKFTNKNMAIAVHSGNSDLIKITLDMHDVTKLADCSAGNNNEMCDACYKKLMESDTFIFNYGTEIKFCLVCRNPHSNYTEKTKNHNHREGIDYQHFPMIQFELDYGLMEYFNGDQIANVAGIEEGILENLRKKCQQTRKQKFTDSWEKIGYDGVQFQFDCQQWDDVATGVVTGSSLEQAQLLLDCDVIRKDDILKKMEDGRKFHKSKTGLEARFLAPQMYDKGRYKVYRNGQWVKLA